MAVNSVFQRDSLVTTFEDYPQTRFSKIRRDALDEHVVKIAQAINSIQTATYKEIFRETRRKLEEV
jgi:hypothetical protein